MKTLSQGHKICPPSGTDHCQRRSMCQITVAFSLWLMHTQLSMQPCIKQCHYMQTVEETEEIMIRRVINLYIKQEMLLS